MNKVLFAVGCVLLFVAGCTVLTTTDPNTGLSTTTYGVDPNNAILATTETIAEVGVAVGGAVAPFLGGAAALIVSALGGALAAWKKIKPRLTTAKTAAQTAIATTTTLVTAIEEFKAVSPDAWAALKDKIKAELAKKGVDSATIVGVIDSIREAL